MVTTGFPLQNGQKTEIIDLNNPCLKCVLLADIPARYGSIGGLIYDQPLICGGKFYDGYQTWHIEKSKSSKLYLVVPKYLNSC